MWYLSPGHCFLNWGPGDPGVARNADENLDILYVVINVSNFTSIIILNDDYEVLFKNGVSHFQREYFGKKQVYNVRAFEAF
jgi:hypothetical protein